MPNYIKYLTNIRVYFTIKKKNCEKQSYVFINFFKNIIGLIQIFGDSYFCRLNFENIKITIYIYIYIERERERERERI